MIRYKSGDLLKEDVEGLVNPVNCYGTMGKGLAFQFKQAFFDNFLAYADECGKHRMKLGQMFVFETGRFVNPKYIINFPTKWHWRNPSRLEDIELGLVSLVKEVKARKIQSIAIPPLGCGLGGLRWEEVSPQIEIAFREFRSNPDVDIVIFSPQ